ncbi:hypothetical protein [Marinomonas sp. PE14-40]|uniref:hypothetical protein n=1 Tax=Marinomonas sp. PE14-40 TaxID=3060621 RepID=UPI003F67363C
MKNLIPKWDTLRIIGKSKVANLTILMPFIGYLILFNQELVNYLELSKAVLNIADDNVEVSNTSISRLYYLYFGLTFVGASSILFSLVCPSIIKANSTEYEFSDHELKVMTHERLFMLIRSFEYKLVRESDLIKSLEKSYSNFIDARNIAAIEATKTGVDVDEREKDIELVESKNILRKAWRYHRYSSPTWRFIISIGYLVGFALVLIPSAQVFIKVINIIVLKF